MPDRTEPQPGWLPRIVRFPLVFLAVLYVVLTYLYLSCYFFRTSFVQDPMPRFAATVIGAAVMLATYANLVRFFERRCATELAPGPMPRELAIGLLLGFGLYSACILVLAGLGVYRIDSLNPWQILLPGLAAPLATGVFEELIFRGGVFRVAEKWFGSWIALVVSSLIFGFVHLENDAATIRGVLAISFWAGILLTATYMLTRRLWFGIGLHAAWNYTQGTVYSGIISGGQSPNQGLVNTTITGPDWLTGGTFGVEASVIAILIGATTGIFMLVAATRRGKILAPMWRRGN